MRITRTRLRSIRTCREWLPPRPGYDRPIVPVEQEPLRLELRDQGLLADLQRAACPAAAATAGPACSAIATDSSTTRILRPPGRPRRSGRRPPRESFSPACAPTRRLEPHPAPVQQGAERLQEHRAAPARPRPSPRSPPPSPPRPPWRTPRPPRPASGQTSPQVGRHLLEGRRQQRVIPRDPGVILPARDRPVVMALPVLDPLREHRALAPRG